MLAFETILSFPKRKIRIELWRQNILMSKFYLGDVLEDSVPCVLLRERVNAFVTAEGPDLEKIRNRSKQFIILCAHGVLKFV